MLKTFHYTTQHHIQKDSTLPIHHTENQNSSMHKYCEKYVKEQI